MEIDVLQHIKDLVKLKCALFTSSTVRKNKLTAIHTEGVCKSCREVAERGKLVYRKYAMVLIHPLKLKPEKRLSKEINSIKKKHVL